MKSLSRYLTYAGAIPFVFSTICLAMGINQFPIMGDIDHFLSMYALIIASFMCGSHWGQHLHLEGKWRLSLSIYSNAMAITLWVLTIFQHSFILYMMGVSVIFLLLLKIDYFLMIDKLVAKDYFQVRCIVTGIVVISLLSTILISAKSM